MSRRLRTPGGPAASADKNREVRSRSRSKSRSPIPFVARADRSLGRAGTYPRRTSVFADTAVQMMVRPAPAEGSLTPSYKPTKITERVNRPDELVRAFLAWYDKLMAKPLETSHVTLLIRSLSAYQWKNEVKPHCDTRRNGHRKRQTDSSITIVAGLGDWTLNWDLGETNWTTNP